MLSLLKILFLFWKEEVDVKNSDECAIHVIGVIITYSQ